MLDVRQSAVKENDYLTGLQTQVLFCEEPVTISQKITQTGHALASHFVLDFHPKPI